MGIASMNSTTRSGCENENLISLKGITKSFKEETSSKVVFDNIDLEFPSKGLFFITGKSGCGKSTLLSLLGGLMPPDSGTYCFGSSSVYQKGGKIDSSFLSSKVSFVFQDFNLIGGLNAVDNIRVVGVSEEEAKRLLSFVGLAEKAKTEANLLSGGEKQRLSLARAIAKKCELLLLDEPTGNLDKENAKFIFDLLRKLSRGILVIAVTHDATLAAQYGDVVYSLRDGKLYSEESHNAFFQSESGNDSVALGEKPAHLPARVGCRFAFLGAGKKWWKSFLCFLSLALSFAFTLIGSSFALFDERSALLDAFTKNDILLTDVMRRESSPGRANYYRTGPRFYEGLTPFFDSPRPFLEGSIEEIHTSLRIVSVDSGFTYKGWKPSFTQENEIILSDLFLKSLPSGTTEITFGMGGYSYSWTKGYPEKTLLVSQDVHPSTKHDSVEKEFSEDVSSANKYPDLYATDYEVAFVSEATFLSLFELPEYHLSASNPVYVQQKNLSEYVNPLSGMFFKKASSESITPTAGSLPKKKNEILVSPSVASDLLGGDEDASKAIGKTFPFYDLASVKDPIPYQQMPNVFDLYPEGFVISGLADIGSLVLAVSDEAFASIPGFLSSYPTGYYVFGTPDSLSSGLTRSGYRSSLQFADSVYSFVDMNQGPLSGVLIGFGTALLILGFSLSLLFSAQALESKKKEFTILRTFGYSPLLLGMLASAAQFIVAIAAIIAGIAASYPVLGYLNQLMRDFARSPGLVPFDILYVRIWFLFALIGIYLLASFASVLGPSRASKKIDLATELKIS